MENQVKENQVTENRVGEKRVIKYYNENLYGGENNDLSNEAEYFHKLFLKLYYETCEDSDSEVIHRIDSESENNRNNKKNKRNNNYYNNNNNNNNNNEKINGNGSIIHEVNKIKNKELETLFDLNCDFNTCFKKFKIDNGYESESDFEINYNNIDSQIRSFSEIIKETSELTNEDYNALFVEMDQMTKAN